MHHGIVQVEQALLEVIRKVEAFEVVGGELLLQLRDAPPGVLHAPERPSRDQNDGGNEKSETEAKHSSHGEVMSRPRALCCCRSANAAGPPLCGANRSVPAVATPLSVMSCFTKW